jgi:hypothetical protein
MNTLERVLRVLALAGKPAQVVFDNNHGCVVRFQDGKTARVTHNSKPALLSIERNGRMAFEDQDFVLSCNATGFYLIPSPVAAEKLRASHAHHLAGDRNRSRTNPMRRVRFDGEPSISHGYAITWAAYKLGDTDAATEAASSAPAPVADVLRNPLILALELPDRRAYFGRPIEICTQMYDRAIFVHDSEPTVDAWIRGSLARMGIECPPTPEFFLGVLVARGEIEIYPPGCRIAPSVDGL